MVDAVRALHDALYRAIYDGRRLRDGAIEPDENWKELAERVARAVADVAARIEPTESAFHPIRTAAIRASEPIAGFACATDAIIATARELIRITCFCLKLALIGSNEDPCELMASGDGRMAGLLVDCRVGFDGPLFLLCGVYRDRKYWPAAERELIKAIGAGTPADDGPIGPDFVPFRCFSASLRKRIRQAATPKRKNMRVRKIRKGGQTLYSRADAKSHWPEEFEVRSGATKS